MYFSTIVCNLSISSKGMNLELLNYNPKFNMATDSMPPSDKSLTYFFSVDIYKQGKHTFGVFVDLQQTYDKVWRKGLLIKMIRMGIHGCIFKINWIQAFLSNRTIATSYNGATSSKRTLEEGLPQGSSLSCTLFLIYINDLAEKLNISKAMFADDLIIWTTDKYPIIAKAKLKRNLLTLQTYCRLWKLKINNKKTVCSCFTLSHKMARKTLELKIDGEKLEKEDNPWGETRLQNDLNGTP